MNQFKDPGCVYVDANDTIFVCDHHNVRVQMWRKSATTGVPVSSISGDHPEALTFDKNGFMYSTGHDVNRVVRFTPNFASYTVVAGQVGAGSAAADRLQDPWGMDVDDNLNLYIAERGNQRVVKWAPSATTGVIVIANTGTTPKFNGLRLVPNTTNQVCVSSEDGNKVYQWTFNAANPSKTWY